MLLIMEIRNLKVRSLVSTRSQSLALFPFSSLTLPLNRGTMISTMISMVTWMPTSPRHSSPDSLLVSARNFKDLIVTSSPQMQEIWNGIHHLPPSNPIPSPVFSVLGNVNRTCSDSQLCLIPFSISHSTFDWAYLLRISHTHLTSSSPWCLWVPHHCLSKQFQYHPPVNPPASNLHPVPSNRTSTLLALISLKQALDVLLHFKTFHGTGLLMTSTANTVACLTDSSSILKGFRAGVPKMCYFHICILLSWRQWRLFSPVRNLK